MISAYLNDEYIQAFDVKNRYGQYVPDRVEELKRAGLKGQIKCPDCGSSLILKAGDIKVPHFAHRRVSPNCYFTKRSSESHEHLMGKLILYTYFKYQDQVEAVFADKRVTEKRFANVVVEQKTQTVAFEIIRQTDYKAYFEKVDEYNATDLLSYWILSYKDFVFEKNHELTLFMRFIEKYDVENVIRMIDTANESLVFKKYYDLMDGDDIVETIEFVKSYPLKDLTFNEAGYFVTDFLEEFEDRKALGAHQFRLEKERRLKEKQALKEETEVLKKMTAEIKVPTYKADDEFGSGKPETLENREEEILELMVLNKKGPWLDSEHVRWGICEECGQILEKDRFKYYRGYDSRGVCDECE